MITPGSSEAIPRKSGTERCSSVWLRRITHCRQVDLLVRSTVATALPVFPKPIMPTFMRRLPCLLPLTRNLHTLREELLLKRLNRRLRSTMR